MYRSSSGVFMTNNTSSGMKKHRESIEQENRQTAKMFTFFHFSSLGGLVHNDFCTKQQHFALSSAPDHCFFTTLKSHEALRTGH